MTFGSNSVGLGRKTTQKCREGGIKKIQKMLTVSESVLETNRVFVLFLGFFY